MNQNTLSVPEVGKSSALLQTGAGGAQSSGEASESEGFLDVLSSVFGSGSEGSEEVESTETSDEVKAETKAKAESADALLEMEADAETEVSADGEPVEVSDSPAGESEIVSEDGETPLTAKATDAMTEGSELLERLDESSQALQGEQSGKALPQQIQGKLSDIEQSDETEQLAEKIKSDPILSKYVQMEGEETPESSAADLAGQTIAAQTTTVQNATATKSGTEEAVSSDIPTEKAVQVSAQLTGEQAVGDIAPEYGEKAVVASEYAQQVNAGKVTNGEQIVWDSATQQVSGDGAVNGPFAVNSAQLNQQAAQLPQGVAPELTDPELLAKYAAAGVEIPAEVDGQPVTDQELEAAISQINWGAPQPESVKVASEMAKSAVQAAGQSQITQQLQQQQLQQQQVQAQALQQMGDKVVAQQAGHTLTPTELNALQAQASPVAQAVASQVQTASSANNAAIAASALTLGAAGVAGMPGKKGDKEKDFSAQLAGIATQQGAQSAQIKADMQQAVSQTQLHLTRETGGEQLAERIQMMLSKNLRNVDIRLDPPELGRMQIRMTMNGDMASVQFTVANQQARDMVEHAMPRLREMLSQQGLQLADSSVHQQSSGQRQGEYATSDGSGGSSQSGGQLGDDDLNLDESINLEANVASKDDGISYYA